MGKGKKGKKEEGKEEPAMAIMVLDPYVEEQVLAARVGTDGDQYDEVWEGVYIVTPLPNNDHQVLVGELCIHPGRSCGTSWAWPSVSRREP